MGTKIYKWGNSGEGPYGRLARFKAKIINSFVKNNRIQSVIDFGCGDGNQLSLFNFPSYIGLDISRTVIKLCMNRFKSDRTKSFFLYNPECFRDNSGIFRADLTLSLDVIYHLVENNIFDLYMNHLFTTSNKFVIIYSSDFEEAQNIYIKRRNFSKYVKDKFPEWKLTDKIENKYPDESFSDFYVYEKIQN